MNKALQLLLLLLACVILMSSALPAKYLSPHVKLVDDDSINKYLDNKHGITYVFVYSHMHVCLDCSSVGSLFNRAAKEYLGQASFIAIDAADKFSSKTAEKFQINLETSRFPLILRSSFEDGKGNTVSPIEMDGLTYPSLKKNLTDHIHYHSQVKQLDGQTLTTRLSFQKYPKPKAILITTKPDVPTSWESLSFQLHDGFDFFVAQKTDRRILRRFDLVSHDQFPVILLLRRTPDDSHLKDTQLEPILYNGIMKASAIRAFLSLYTTQRGDYDSDDATQTPMADIVQDVYDQHKVFLPAITDLSCLRAYCLENPNGGLCAFYILPRYAQRSELDYQVEVVKAVQDLRAENGLNFMMFHGNSSTQDILKVFDITPQDYGQIIVVNPKKLLTSTFLGAFTPDNINSWIAEVLAGSAATAPMSSDLSGLERLFNSSSSQCADVLTKRKQHTIDEQAMKKSQTKPTPSQSSHGAQASEQQNSPERWNPPYRPRSKRGEVRELTDSTWEPWILKRSIPALIQFLNRDGSISDDVKLASTPNELSDVENFVYVGKTLNSMVECFYVQCTDQTAHIRSLFGINLEDGCTGGIYLLQPRVLLTPEHTDLKAIESELVLHAQYYTVQPSEVNEKLKQTFSTDKLTKFALAVFDKFEVHKLDSAPDSFQNWLLTSIHEPRVLIFTAKAAPVLAKALALEFNGFASVAIVGADHESLKHQFQITTLPAVRIIRPTLKPRAEASDQFEMSLELIPIPNDQLYYNSIAIRLDSIVTVRHQSVKAQKYEELRSENKLEEMQRNVRQRDEQARSKDEL